VGLTGARRFSLTGLLGFLLGHLCDVDHMESRGAWWRTAACSVRAVYIGHARGGEGRYARAWARQPPRLFSKLSPSPPIQLQCDPRRCHHGAHGPERGHDRCPFRAATRRDYHRGVSSSCRRADSRAARFSDATADRSAAAADCCATVTASLALPSSRRAYQTAPTAASADTIATIKAPTATRQP